MRITITNEASEALAARIGKRTGTVRLVYDTEGCGCAVNGVPTLWIVDAPAAGDVNVGSGGHDVWLDPNHVIYFEDTVKLGYSADSGSFRLFSDSQIYNARLAVPDRRTAPVT